MAGGAQAFVAVALVVVFVVCALRALRSGGPGELWWALGSVALLADTFVIVRARVLTIPLFFVVVIVLLYWTARRAAERDDVENESR